MGTWALNSLIHGRSFSLYGSVIARTFYRFLRVGMENIQKNEKGDEQHSARQTETSSSGSFQITKDLDLESGDEFQRANSWRRRPSRSLSRGMSLRLTLEEVESDEKVAEAGDDGGKSLEDSEQKWREDDSTGIEGTLPDDALMLSYAFRSRDGTTQYTASPVSPLPSDFVCPLSDHHLLGGRSPANVVTDALDRQIQQQRSQVNQKQLPCLPKYASLLAHLAFFGILGVLIRYGLQVLFGPNVAKVTNDLTPLYIDLPSNMVGSFFMGWVGVVFKRDLSLYSEFLAIGLSTGLMGSITTLTGWIQKVVDLTTRGHCVAGLVSLLLGMELAQMSLSMGIESAKLLKKVILYIHNQTQGKWTCFLCTLYFYKFQQPIFSLITIMIIVGILWCGSIILIILNFSSHHRSKLWWACVFGPAGVWIRWYLARLNGKGVGSQGRLKWLPVGTLLTNLIAVAFMATLSIINLLVKSKNAHMVIGGLELGFLGCLSTVSTFVTEVHALHQSVRPWRAYAYVALTLVPTFILGTLLYSIPVWTKGYSEI